VLVAAAASALALFPTAAAAGVPAWCKDAAFGSERYDLKDLSAREPRDVIITFAKASCAPTPEADAGRAEIEKARQAWSKKLNMIEADWADSVAYAKSDTRSQKIEYSTKDLAAFTPIDQYKALTDGFPQPNGNAPFQDPFYIADVLESQLSEVGRLGFIEECLRIGDASVTSIPSVTWALCQIDIDRFDPAKFSDQLRTDTAHGGELRMALRLRLLALPAELKDHEAAIKKMFAKDETYKKVFEVAAKARAEWTAGPGANARLVALAQAMDGASFAQSRRAFEGCEDKTTAALTAEISKIPAKAFAGMKDIRDDPFKGFAAAAGPMLVKLPNVALAAVPFILCHPKSGTAGLLSAFLQDTPGYRGPRTAGISKVMLEKIVLDDLNARVEYPSFNSRPYSGGHGAIGSAGGVIAKIKPTGEVLTVDLEKLLIKRMECVKEHHSKRIERITADGRVDYELICDQMGMVTHDATWGAFKIKKMFAPLLKKGVMFSSTGHQEEGADVIAIWPSKAAELPSLVLGAAVK
jgi:hypothetical protein